MYIIKHLQVHACIYIYVSLSSLYIYHFWNHAMHCQLLDSACNWTTACKHCFTVNTSMHACKHYVYSTPIESDIQASLHHAHVYFVACRGFFIIQVLYILLPDPSHSITFISFFVTNNTSFRKIPLISATHPPSINPDNQRSTIFFFLFTYLLCY